MAGRPLHEGSNHFVLFDKYSPSSPCSSRGDRPSACGLWPSLGRALAQDPEQRYQTASDLADALHIFRSHLSDDQARSNLAQWLKAIFSMPSHHERSFERFERFEVLSDGQVVENAPSTEDATSMWDFSMKMKMESHPLQPCAFNQWFFPWGPIGWHSATSTRRPPSAGGHHS